MTPRCQLGVSSCFFPPYVSWVGGVLELGASIWSPSVMRQIDRGPSPMRGLTALCCILTQKISQYARLRCIPVLHNIVRTVSIFRPAFQWNPFYLSLLPQAAAHGLLSKAKWNWWDYTDGHLNQEKSHLNGRLSNQCIPQLPRVGWRSYTTSAVWHLNPFIVT